MKCKECPEGRRFAKGRTYCVLYGMIIRDEHECTREGGRRHDGDGDHGAEGADGTEIQGDSCGVA